MDFLSLASDCASFVAPQTLEAIVKTESNYQPLTIGVNGGYKLQRQPTNLEEAIVTAQRLLDNGYNIDLGLGQVNSSNLNRVGLSVHDAFDPCKNIKAAGTIFHKGYQTAIQQYPEEQAFKAALSAYNTGNFIQGFSNGYVQKVLNNMPNKFISPSSSTLSTAVQPIPLVNSQKPTLPYTVKAKFPDIQSVSLTVDYPQKATSATVPTAFVYSTGGNRENPVQGSTSPEPSINVYGANPSNVMVYR